MVDTHTRFRNRCCGSWGGLGGEACFPVPAGGSSARTKTFLQTNCRRLTLSPKSSLRQTSPPGHLPGSWVSDFTERPRLECQKGQPTAAGLTWEGIPFGGRHRLPVHGVALVVKVRERDKRNIHRLSTSTVRNRSGSPGSRLSQAKGSGEAPTSTGTSGALLLAWATLFPVQSLSGIPSRPSSPAKTSGPYMTTTLALSSRAGRRCSPMGNCTLIVSPSFHVRESVR